MSAPVTSPAPPPTPPATPPAIDVRGVRRVYKAKPKPVVALDGIDLEVAPGELFGLLGPNGAGKTTLIKILTTLLLPSEGTARVFGFDVATQTTQVRRIMNIVSGGEQSGYGLLQVREQLWMFSQFYGVPVRDGWRRVDQLIEAVGLVEQRHQKISVLSTGQRQKLNLARGPHQRPLDPVPRRAHAGARCLGGARRARAGPGVACRGAGSHDPAHEPLHGRGGRAVRPPGHRGPGADPGHRDPAKSSSTGSRAARSSASSSTTSTTRAPGWAGCRASVAPRSRSEEDTERQTVVIDLQLDDDAVLSEVISTLTAQGSHLVSLQKREPTLEDVFVELVGRGFSGDDDAEATGDVEEGQA